MTALNKRKNPRNQYLNNPRKTHEGAPAAQLSTFQELERSVGACLLWEDGFYENGSEIADRIHSLIKELPSEQHALAMGLAINTRQKMNIRHAPLWMIIAFLKYTPPKHRGMIQHTIFKTVSRVDEITELLAMHKHTNKKLHPIPAQLKKGLGQAFNKFDEYQFGKYNRKTEITLKDAMRLVHPKPEAYENDKLFFKIKNDDIATPDTWEVNLSAGADKKETFTRLLEEKKLGYMALLRNLRNMQQAGVPPQLVKQALLEGNARRVLPFRFVAAMRAVPQWASLIDEAYQRKANEVDFVFPGRTAILVDISGSMTWSTRRNPNPNSKQQPLMNMDAAAALGTLFRGEEKRVFSFSNDVKEVPNLNSLGMIENITRSQPNGGTDLRKAVEYVNAKVPYDRLIVITDEQSMSPPPPPKTGTKGYMINVASNQNGVGYGPWDRVTGFSESIFRWMAFREGLMD